MFRLHYITVIGVECLHRSVICLVVYSCSVMCSAPLTKKRIQIPFKYYWFLNGI